MTKLCQKHTTKLFSIFASIFGIFVMASACQTADTTEPRAQSESQLADSADATHDSNVRELNTEAATQKSDSDVDSKNDAEYGAAAITDEASKKVLEEEKSFEISPEEAARLVKTKGTIGKLAVANDLLLEASCQVYIANACSCGNTRKCKMAKRFVHKRTGRMASFKLENSCNRAMRQLNTYCEINN